MSRDRAWSQTSASHQVGVVNSTSQGFGSSNMYGTSSNWTWRSSPHLTNSSSVHPETPSGLVPGLIAAGIFIMFLLCLYAILWKCMVSPPRKRRRKGDPTSPNPQKLLVV